MKKTMILMLSLIAVSSAAVARDGDYFLSFQSQGRQRDAISAAQGTGVYNGVLALQSNGQIVVATSSDASVNGNPDFVIKRLNSDGSADSAFANGTGEQRVAFDRGGGNADNLSAIVLQADGKIILSGSSDGDPNTSASDWAIVRLTTTGALDTTFAGTGMKTFSFNLGQNATQQTDTCLSVGTQQDGKIVLAGSAQNGNAQQMAVARLQTTGAMDPTFLSNIGNTGMRTLSFGAGDLGGRATRVRQLPDGKLLVIGVEVQAGGAGWGLAKLNADGTADTSFGPGGSGYVFYKVGLGGVNELPYDFVALPDNSFVVVGAADTGTASGTDMAIVKFLANGNVDSSFGNSGRQIVAFDFGGGNNDVATAIARDPQGRYVIGGYINVSNTLPSGNSDFMVLRLLPNGQFDSNFGQIGTQEVRLSVAPTPDYNEIANSLMIAPDGSIFIGGSAATTPNGGPYAIGVIKLIGDTIFGDNFGN